MRCGLGEMGNMLVLGGIGKMLPHNAQTHLHTHAYIHTHMYRTSLLPRTFPAVNQCHYSAVILVPTIHLARL